KMQRRVYLANWRRKAASTPNWDTTKIRVHSALGHSIFLPADNLPISIGGKMITKASHFSIFVLDQASAYDFYINKLGFKVNTDAELGPKGRWLTVNPP